MNFLTQLCQSEWMWGCNKTSERSRGRIVFILEKWNWMTFTDTHRLTHTHTDAHTLVAKYKCMWIHTIHIRECVVRLCTRNACLFHFVSLYLLFSCTHPNTLSPLVCISFIIFPRSFILFVLFACLLSVRYFICLDVCSTFHAMYCIHLRWSWALSTLCWAHSHKFYEWNFYDFIFFRFFFVLLQQIFVIFSFAFLSIEIHSFIQSLWMK